MRASTRLENKQNYGAICITYLFLIPKKSHDKAGSGGNRLAIPDIAHHKASPAKS